MARKIVAVTPRGTFTRRSDRPYLFVVVVGGRTESSVRASMTSQYAHYSPEAADAEVARHAAMAPRAYGWSMSDRNVEKMAAQAREHYRDVEIFPVVAEAAK